MSKYASVLGQTYSRAEGWEMLQKIWISDDMQNGTMAKSYFHIIFAEIQLRIIAITNTITQLQILK